MSHPVATSSACRLLVVEPDPKILNLIVSVAAWYFTEVVSVADYRAASQGLAQTGFSAVIADYQLTGGGGLALYEEVRRNHPTMLFILISSDLRVALSDTHFRFLLKPFAMADLSTLLRAVSQPVRRTS